MSAVALFGLIPRSVLDKIIKAILDAIAPLGPITGPITVRVFVAGGIPVDLVLTAEGVAALVAYQAAAAQPMVGV